MARGELRISVWWMAQKGDTKALSPLLSTGRRGEGVAVLLYAATVKMLQP
jgi:hypothetical protein